MKRLRTWMLAGVILVLSPFSLAQDSYEEAGEFMKIEIQYHTSTVGLIWAYKCPTCSPDRFMFDNRLVVRTAEGDTSVQGLRLFEGKPAVITWMPNTFQALRVLPIQ